MREITANAGEPMITGFDPDTLGAELKNLGWRLEENIGPAEIEKRYFQDRADGYHALEHAHFTRAAVDTGSPV